MDKNKGHHALDEQKVTSVEGMKYGRSHLLLPLF